VKNDLNYSIFTLRNYPDGTLVALKIVDPVFSWDVSIWYSSLQELSEGAHVVRQLIHDEIVRLVHEGRWSALLADDTQP